MRNFFGRWQGVILSLIVLSATLWLALTGRLALYIHPRYVTFTVVMALLAAAFVVAALVYHALTRADVDRGAHNHDGHPHDGHAHDGQAHDDQGDGASGKTSARSSGMRRGLGALSTGGSALVVVAAALALLLVPPATLTSGTAASREMNAGTAAVADDFVTVGADYKNFTVKDWSSLLGQISTESFYDGKSVDVTGFISPDAVDPDNVFYVSRFIVTCCAVDAQPVGVPVYAPGWADDFSADTWVHVTGPFVFGVSDGPPVLVEPDDISVVDQPADPYVH